jgi:hypothetical protein
VITSTLSDDSFRVRVRDVPFVCGGFRAQIIDRFLQSAIPADVIFTIDEAQIQTGPDVFYEQDPAALAARISSALGRRLPELRFEAFSPTRSTGRTSTRPAA